MKQALKKKAINRLRRVAGQLRGLEKMIELDKYCPDILVQSLAVQKSLQGFNQVVLENHLQQHVILNIGRGKQTIIVEELLKIYKLSNPIA